MLPRRKKRSTPEDIKPLPPKIPGSIASMERAIVLLGNRVQNELNPKSRQELIELIDIYPDANTAATWKQALRQLIKDKQQSSSNSLQQIAQINPETSIIFSWLKEALSELYWEEKNAYDPELAKQMSVWYKKCPPQNSPKTYLVKKFLELHLAWSKTEDETEFDLADLNFNLEADPLIEHELTFIEPLLRLALEKVDFEFLGDYLVKELALEI
ncbi:hypothetical protein [Gloeothece verrucosa]|uniref:Uncharacterized protein n=1 Tax=Gloeothece verrucosa (strain PCC 7822) TaxID=497965 RepID=E0U8C0_GLOV7|nr:hypothetical protein [Gloeothece verrucosa]ADN12556.1 hypothetical protein Cyan7822_0516 [Gloeothece verrucosa PCC 7822]